MNENVFIGLGTNLGDRIVHLNEAMKTMEKQVGKILRKSSFYETEPWGYPNQPYFLNAVIKIQTSLPPTELLDTLLLIEKEMGRKRTFKNAARIIDLDLLFYGDNILQADRLTLPHPLIQERKFVLLPLVEIAPDWMHPVLNEDMETLLKSTADDLKVTVYKTE